MGARALEDARGRREIFPVARRPRADTCEIWGGRPRWPLCTVAPCSRSSSACATRFARCRCPRGVDTDEIDALEARLSGFESKLERAGWATSKEIERDYRRLKADYLTLDEQLSKW